MDISTAEDPGVNNTNLAADLPTGLPCEDGVLGDCGYWYSSTQRMFPAVRCLVVHPSVVFPTLHQHSVRHVPGRAGKVGNGGT